MKHLWIFLTLILAACSPTQEELQCDYLAQEMTAERACVKDFGCNHNYRMYRRIEREQAEFEERKCGSPHISESVN